MYLEKLFEIPVYKYSPEALAKKVKKHKAKIRQELSNSGPKPDIIERCVNLATYPQRLWDYNHIIGYIRISLSGYDIMFDVFLPTPRLSRYYWTAWKKHFLYNISANGTHFYAGNIVTNKDIQKKTGEMLDWVIKDHIPQKYYVDRASFDNLNTHLDYRAIMEDKYNG